MTVSPHRDSQCTISKQFIADNSEADYVLTVKVKIHKEDFIEKGQIEWFEEVLPTFLHSSNEMPVLKQKVISGLNDLYYDYRKAKKIKMTPEERTQKLLNLSR
jgi:hypothetical protein